MFDSAEILPFTLTYVFLKIFQQGDSHLPPSVSCRSPGNLGADTVSRHVVCVGNQCASRTPKAAIFRMLF